MKKATRIKSRLSSFSPSQILLLSFIVAIFIGTILLALPIASIDRKSIGLFSALFTSASATCVTGLTLTNIGTSFSFFGQIVILALVQVGGLGIMTASTLISLILGKRIGLQDRLYLRESFNADSITGIVNLTRQALIFTFSIEAIGAIILALRLYPAYGAHAIWQGIFLAVSSFSNAGFDILVGTYSLMGIQNDPVVLITIGILIMLGSLGFIIMHELFHKTKWVKLSLQAKLVLVVTIGLTSMGTLCFFLFEHNNPGTFDDMTLPMKWINSFFQSVTTRSAGFYTVDQNMLRPASTLLTMVLMFIGASPSSTGGGIKTTTLALLILVIPATIQDRKDITIFGRRFPSNLPRKALLVLFLFLLSFIFLSIAICAVEAFTPPYFSAMDMCFEALSTITTVGLTTGITPYLSQTSLFLLIIGMLIGRLGPLTLVLALQNKHKSKNSIHYPEERVMIG